jgi:uncharacterized membrane protein
MTRSLIVAVVVFGAACSTSDNTPGPRPTVGGEVHHDTSAPLRDLVVPPYRAPVSWPARALPRAYGAAHTAVVQDHPGVAASVTNLLNFNGIGNGFAGPQGSFTVDSAPPDPAGDIGPNHYVQLVNSSFAVFNKSGTVVYGPVATNTLWSGFGGLCQTDNDGDGAVLYDPVSDRWVISQFAVSNANGSSVPFLECVAVSQTPDPTGAWYRYAFPYTGFPDYPKMGVWPDAYYETFNMFNAAGTAFLGAKACAYDRAKMLIGAAATQVCFDLVDAGQGAGGVLPADLDGARLPPAGSPNYLVALGNNPNQLATWAFHVNFASPASSTLTGPTDHTVAAFAEACDGGTCIPQSGTNEKLDSLADRLMYRFAYRNLGDHEALVVSHAVTAGSSVGVRWYELRVTNGALTVFQQGTYAPDSNYRWMSSAAMDQSGNIALGFSRSGSSLHPSINTTGRLAGDAAGVMTQGENTIINGAGSQLQSLTRWGDYSMMTVDPVDDCTFFYTNEYIPANGTFNWSTRIASFKFPGCGATVVDDFSIDVSPATLSLDQGANGTATISTAVVSGAAQSVSLSIVGLPSGATASFSPGSVTAGNSSTLTIGAGVAPPGTYTLTITGTAAAEAHTTSLTLVVTAPVPDDFSISATPTTLVTTQGGSAVATIDTAVTSGNAQSVTLAVESIVPTSDITATLSPASITTGASSTLTVTAGAAAFAGTYTITIAAIGASATHTVALTLIVLPNDFSISVAPDSVSAVQGSTASTTITTAVTSGSAETIALSVSGLPSGATATVSPASVSSGGSAALTLDAGTAAPGTYALVVTGTAASGSHDAALGFTVVAPVLDDFSISASPSTIAVVQGGTAATTIATAVTSGNAQTVALSAAGLPAGATATISPGSVASGSSATVTIAAGASTPVGTYDVTITGTGPSATHVTDVTVVVSAPVPNDFSIGASPAAVSVLQGGSATTTISTAVTSGVAQTVSLSASGLPSGASASLSVVSIVAGGSTTLSLVAGAATPAGTYAITVTGTGASATHATTVAFTVSATGIVNGGFETGDFTGWTAAGTTAVVGGGHSGSFAAQLGQLHGAPPGDSTITQTFTAPVTGGTLTFWYHLTCRDSGQHEWASASLVDTTTSVATTLLPNTCTHDDLWHPVHVTVAGGHSLTLTLVSHDGTTHGQGALFDVDDVAIGP